MAEGPDWRLFDLNFTHMLGSFFVVVAKPPQSETCLKQHLNIMDTSL